MLHLSVSFDKRDTYHLRLNCSYGIIIIFMYICLCADKTRHQFRFQTNDNNYTYSAAAKNYPPIVPTPLSSSLRSKTHELQQEALLMPRAITKLPIPTTTKNYPPIVPTPLSSSLRSKTHELSKKHCLCPEL